MEKMWYQGESDVGTRWSGRRKCEVGFTGDAAGDRRRAPVEERRPHLLAYLFAPIPTLTVVRELLLAFAVRLTSSFNWMSNICQSERK